ncbi:MAG: hypothetical protein ACOC8F_05325 [Planctomycetota bacterium]
MIDALLVFVVSPATGTTTRPFRLGADAVVGAVLIVTTLVVMAGLVLWSRGAIERMGRQGYPSARPVVRTDRRE